MRLCIFSINYFATEGRSFFIYAYLSNNKKMKKNPLLSLNQSLLVLRISVAIVFIAHAVVRLFLKGSLVQFGNYLNEKGFAGGVAIVWGITIFEIIGGIAMAMGYFTKWLTAGFIAMLIAGIIIIHAGFGWFVGEHGTGGSEYSFILIVALLVIMAADKKTA
jgi:putative oxidoreductase